MTTPESYELTLFYDVQTKKFELEYKALDPILCFQIQIRDRDCIPTPGMQIQIGRPCSTLLRNWP